MTKIFEKIEFTDGGIHDKGVILGYHIGESSEQLLKDYNINHGFIQFREIDKVTFIERKR